MKRKANEHLLGKLTKCAKAVFLSYLGQFDLLQAIQGKWHFDILYMTSWWFDCYKEITCLTGQFLRKSTKYIKLGHYYDYF